MKRFNSQYDSVWYSETQYIKTKTNALGRERLAFLDGKRLDEVSIFIEDKATLRRVRRIVEKRVSQDFYKVHPRRRDSARYELKHQSANAFKNIYGSVPKGFVYCCAA